MDSVRIGKKLVELRGARTQEEVAKDNGISISAIGMYERGERIPRDEIKIKLARYYGVSVGDIFFALNDTSCVENEVKISRFEAINKSYPSFAENFTK